MAVFSLALSPSKSVLISVDEFRGPGTTPAKVAFASTGLRCRQVDGERCALNWEAWQRFASRLRRAGDVWQLQGKGALMGDWLLLLRWWGDPFCALMLWSLWFRKTGTYFSASSRVSFLFISWSASSFSFLYTVHIHSNSWLTGKQDCSQASVQNTWENIVFLVVEH